MTSVLFPGASHGANFKLRTAQFVFRRCPYFVSTLVFLIWRSTTGNKGLDQFFNLPSPRYRMICDLLTRIPGVSETARFMLDSETIDRAVCDIIEYGPDRQLGSSSQYLEATSRILGHFEFHGKLGQEHYRAAIPNDDIYDNDRAMADAIDRFDTLDGSERSRVGGWLYFALRKLLLLVYHDGRGEQVPQIGARSLQLQSRLRRDLPRPSKELARILDSHDIDMRDLKLISPDWSALIGHMGHLDVHLRMREMGWWKGAPLLATYSGRIANRPFLSLLQERCPVVVLEEGLKPEVWVELCGLTKYFGVSHQIWGTEERPAGYWNDWGAVALKEWSDRGLGYPMRDAYDRQFQTSDEAMSSFDAMRQHFGMTQDDWYVCLHMRDANTRGEKEGRGETVRNASLANYLDTVKYITAQGGWVVRMGGPNVPPLPSLPRVIDYARSSFRSPLMDLHLVRNARYFIGTTSGFAYVATGFGVPTVMVNCISSIGLLWTENTRFALKPLRTTAGRLLTQRELTSDRWRWSFPTHESLSEAGLVLGENSSDEILETVKEVEQIALGHTARSPLIARWEASLSIPGFFGASLPSRHFLEKYETQFLD
ncbi:TIGR04372 family glycosyltransferase [Bradyrhizobium sp. HKCCYLS20291]|uniref:TIGR04372 family glycosyltransferase n=1 Tax=Bradyrhizobium sp. HKCCYLS20291 TaxID=3420766 RepID=UPI003EB6F224